MIAPPFTRPLRFMCIGLMSISPTTFLRVSEVTRTPSACGMPPWRTGVAPTRRFCGSGLGALARFFFVAIVSGALPRTPRS
jgi:hypothetical protein